MTSQLTSTERESEFINKGTFDFVSSVFPMKNFGDQPLSVSSLFHIYGPSFTVVPAREKETMPLNPNIPLKSETYQLLNYIEILKKLEALKGVVGLLSDLPERELKIFEGNIKRRPLFE